MLNIIAMGGVIVSLLAPMSTTVETAEAAVTAPDGVILEVVDANGTGCPEGWGVVKQAADNTSFELTAPTSVAIAGGNHLATEFRKNCQVSLQMSKPAGWTYAVSWIDSSGFAYLSDGAKGVERVSYYFQGSSVTGIAGQTLLGPLAEPWTTTTVVAADALNFAPCDVERNLNLNSEVRVNLGTANPEDTSFLLRNPTTSFGLVWKQCETEQDSETE